MTKLKLGRYDYAGYLAFVAYAMCSLSLPLVIVEMGQSLNFPLDKGGMTAGGGLHLVRSIALVIALLLCGALAGYAGKRRAMGLSMLLMGSGIVLCACIPSYFLMLPCLLLSGMGEGICEGMATPFVQDLHSEAPERYVNISHSMWSVGTFLCVMVSGGLLTWGAGWRLVLLICGILGLLVSLMFFWRENPASRYPEHAETSDLSVLFQKSCRIARCGRFWVYCLGMFMGAGSEFCLTFWMAAYLRLNFQTTAWSAALGTAAIALGMFTGRLVFGYYARKQYLKHLLLACSLGTIPLSLLLVYLKPEMFHSRTALLAMLLMILVLCGIGVAPYWPTLQVYGVTQLPELDATLLYVYFSAVGVPGCGFFTWIMGVLGDRIGLRAAFVMLPLSLAAYALIIILEGWIWPRKDKSLNP